MQGEVPGVRNSSWTLRVAEGSCERKGRACGRPPQNPFRPAEAVADRAARPASAFREEGSAPARRRSHPLDRQRQGARIAQCGARARDRHRSEEHTSELQSLMRISYAVFCLKKKKHQIQYTNNYTQE